MLRFILVKRTLFTTNQPIGLTFSQKLLKLSQHEKSQTNELEYSTVQEWSPKEVNIFLKERFANDWNALKEFGFETHEVTGSTLLKLKADDLRKADTIEQISGKTIYIQAYNNEKYMMYDEDDLRNFLKAVDGKGLESIDDNNEVPNVITSLRNIHSNQYYRINASHLTAVKRGVIWSKIEDQVMEEETLSAVQNALNEKIKASTKIFSKRIMHDQEGRPSIEWDGILICDDRVFLCETKHNMTLKHVVNLINRLKDFPKKLETTSDLEFKQLLGKQHIGVACRTKFPEELKSMARDELGLIVVFPGGGRYKVEMPKNLCIGSV
ncbi:4318_t:CDS:2 [Diversispora eburnea]|uniref:4318_t:CDS:1 n=1 Tax=Diversispora eburnea TaxID=1213867 RepID=A0A9N9B6U8_9GLOM|nr:4318_t:CDS:2 [Diversispora eburnea]